MLCLVPQLITSSLTSSPIIQNKHDSLSQRIQETKQVFEYLSEHPGGAGFGGAKKLLKNSISVGYVNVIADSGLIGGLLYITSFVILAWLAILVVLGCYGRSRLVDSDSSRILIATATMVVMTLFMGLQREPPDSTYWHFWILASFIFMYSLSKTQFKNDSFS